MIVTEVAVERQQLWIAQYWLKVFTDYQLLVKVQTACRNQLAEHPRNSLYPAACQKQHDHQNQVE
jgi:hypothetical protein